MDLPLVLLLAAVTSLPDWMAGCWSGQSGPLTFEEQWTKPAGDNMMGMARTLKAGRVVFSEFMRIGVHNGQLIYTPRIGTNTRPVEFALKSQTAEQIVFENLAHDFPQRIVYRRTSDGLHARIEGSEKGKQRAEDFPMNPVACK
jgi:hypothetical protein